MAYGLAGIAALMLAFIGGAVLAGRRPPPTASAEIRAVPLAEPLPASIAAPPQPAPDPSAAIEKQLQALRTQVEMEASVVAALRDQADQARRELADLQQQARMKAALPRSPAQVQPVPSNLAVAQPPSRPTGARVVMRASAHVRASPAKHGAVERTAPRGAVLNVFAHSGNWVQVGEDAPWGWVYSNLLNPAS